MKAASIVLALCALSPICFAQRYTPIGKSPVKSPSRGGLGLALVLKPSILHCDPVPTWNQIKTKQFDTHLQIMTAAQAASLNVTFVGSASGSYNADQLLAVSDSSRVAPCIATDGKTTLYYGETIRTVVAMNDYTVKGNASFAVVAATATADGKSNSVDLYEIGFGDPKLDAKLVFAKQTLGGAGINIEDYSDFIKAYNAAESYALTISKPGIDLVASDVQLPSTAYADTLASAWAIQKIAQGYGCEDAISKYKLQGQQYENDINSVYDAIAGGCGVDDVARAKAKELLNGLQIKY